MKITQHNASLFPALKSQTNVACSEGLGASEAPFCACTTRISFLMRLHSMVQPSSIFRLFCNHLLQRRGNVLRYVGCVTLFKWSINWAFHTTMALRGETAASDHTPVSEAQLTQNVWRCFCSIWPKMVFVSFTIVSCSLFSSLGMQIEHHCTWLRQTMQWFKLQGPSRNSPRVCGDPNSNSSCPGTT